MRRNRRWRVADWSLRITFCDEPNNEFVCIGGATWKTKRERDANLARIPKASKDSPYILDIMRDFDILSDRLITVDTVEQLMGKPIQLLIDDARRNALQANNQKVSHA